MSAPPEQQKWFGLEIRGDSMKPMGFPLDLILPALNAGGLQVERNEYRIRDKTVDVVFQQSSRRNTAWKALAKYTPKGGAGRTYPQIWLGKEDHAWSKSLPFRALTSDGRYSDKKIRDELEWQIRTWEDGAPNAGINITPGNASYIGTHCPVDAIVKKEEEDEDKKVDMS